MRTLLMRVSAAIPRGRPPGNPRATHGLSRGFVAKACPARGALERFCVFGKIPRGHTHGICDRIKNSRHSAIQESVHCILRKATSRFQFHTVSSHSKRLADRKRQCDEQPQAKKVCPRKLEFEDSIETCVDFSADVASVNHDHSYFCIEEQATPTICCPGCSRGGGICPNFLPYPRGFSMYLSRQL